MAKAFGLDFGTTNSALACATTDGGLRLAQFGNETTFRSILYFDEDESSSSHFGLSRGRMQSRIT